MAGRHPQSLRPRDERAHPVIKDALAKGYLGTGQPYVVDGFATQEAADQGRRSINNAARHLGVSCSSRSAEHVEQLSDGTWRVSFTIWPKNQGRAHIASTYGHDPASMPYNPFRRAEGRMVDDSGAFT